MKRYFLILFCAILSIAGMAQNTRTIRGLVMDDNEEPLAGVTIKVIGSNINTTSSHNGRFEIKIPVNANEIEASKEGYSSSTAEIDGGHVILRLKYNKRISKSKFNEAETRKEEELEARTSALKRENVENETRETTTYQEKSSKADVNATKADTESQIRAEIEAKIRAEIEAEAKMKAEIEAKIRAEIEAEKEAKAEAEAKAKIETEIRAKLEAEAKAKAEEEAKAKAEEEARAKAEAEAKAKAEEEEEAKAKAEAEAKAKAEEEAKAEAEAEAKAKAEEEARAKATEDVKSKEKSKAEVKLQDEYIDLNLPSGTKWATCNMGASTPEECGDYFAWGELDPKSNYATFNSITHDKRFKEIAGNSHYDAVTAKLGNSFHTPTLADFEELIKNCVWAQSSINGVNGFLVTGSNGNSIFLPASGYRDGTSYNNDGKLGEYWTSTPHKDSEYSYYLFFSGDSYSTFWNSRYAGRCIRPVKK